MMDIGFIMCPVPLALKFCYTCVSLNDLSSEAFATLIGRILSSLIYWTSHIHDQIWEINSRNKTFKLIQLLSILFS